MKSKFIFLTIVITFLLSGCVLDPYQNPKYGEMAVDAWFSNKTLGETRKTAENIDKIVSKECEFIESKENKYVFNCKITYKEKGETVIPLSKNSVMSVYVVFIKENGKTYDYKVYNSKYTKSGDKIWEQDEYLDY